MRERPAAFLKPNAPDVRGPVPCRICHIRDDDEERSFEGGGGFDRLDECF
jgi:hypothetical protein